MNDSGEEYSLTNKPFWRRVGLDKIGLFLISLFLFIFSLILMKHGARSLAPLIQNHFSVSNPANGLGFGWIFAYLLMSGSPVAAASLTFFDAEIIDRSTTFFMITGSRLGASFIVLFIGFIYVLRGHSRTDSLGMGLLSLIVTGSTYFAALPVGFWLLERGTIDHIQMESGAALSSVFEKIIDPLIGFLLQYFPLWFLFLIGLVFLIVSFSLFDKSVPKMTLSTSQIGHVGQYVYRPWVMFFLGALITLISMSVSVSLAILVPLSQHGFVRRENVIPYIMGANITTFVDTLFAAVLVNNPTVFTIVLVQMVSVGIVSVIILVADYQRYQHIVLKAAAWVISGKARLALFMLLLFLVPLGMLLI